MNYYRRYAGDYLRDTARLSLIEHGAYSLMMDYYYSDEQPLPLDRQELYTMLRAMKPEDRKAVDRVVGLFFTRQDDGFHQKRIDHEIAVAQKARGSGKLGGRPVTDGQTDLLTDSVTDSQTDDQTDSITDSQTDDQTDSITDSQTDFGHPPTSNHQPPSSNRQPPASNRHPKAKRRSEGARGASAREGRGVESWNRYADAYRLRYGIDPVRNGKTNGQMAKLVDQLGADEAPKVAGFYLTHNGGLYVSSGHCVDLLLRDCAKLRTEMLTGRRITRREVRDAEHGDALRAQVGRVEEILKGSKS